jgi:hypothetical protein
MKKLLRATILLSLLSLLILPMVASAQVCGNGVCEPPTETPTGCSQDCAAPVVDPFAALNSIINWLFILLLITAVIFIIIAAFYFVTASGNPEQTAKARNFVLYALVGVLVAFLARGLIILVRRVAGQ